MEKPQASVVRIDLRSVDIPDEATQRLRITHTTRVPGEYPHYIPIFLIATTYLALFRLLLQVHNTFEVWSSI